LESNVSGIYKAFNAIRFMYPDRALPVKSIVLSENKDPLRVRSIFGSIGFDFVRIIEFEVDDGTILHHFVAEPDTYYWGQEMSLQDLAAVDGLDGIEGITSNDRFVLTSWGALIPLESYEIVIPYPEVEELPANMRIDDSK